MASPGSHTSAESTEQEAVAVAVAVAAEDIYLLVVATLRDCGSIPQSRAQEEKQHLLKEII